MRPSFRPCWARPLSRISWTRRRSPKSTTNSRRFCRARRIRTADGLHEALLRLGDLSLEEVAARAADPEVAGFAEALVGEKRAVEVRLAGERRLIAVEDAALYRDALAIALPGSVPKAFLGKTDGGLAALIDRFARTRGPFTTADLSARFGLARERVLAELEVLEANGRLIRGPFTRCARRRRVVRRGCPEAHPSALSGPGAGRGASGPGPRLRAFPRGLARPRYRPRSRRLRVRAGEILAMPCCPRSINSRVVRCRPRPSRSTFSRAACRATGRRTSTCWSPAARWCSRAGALSARGTGRSRSTWRPTAFCWVTRRRNPWRETFMRR